MTYSVIIPCYNVEKYILSTIESVLNQNYNDLELILVNDGSTDSTLSILNKFINRTNVIIIDKPNGGVSSARNTGIEVSSGEYLMFLDGDDCLKPNLFRDVSLFFKKNGFIDMISYGYEIINIDKNITINSSKKYDKKIVLGTELLNLYLIKEIKQCMCSFLVKRELVTKQKILFNEKTYNGEDQEFQIRCMLKSNKVVYLANTYFMYIMRKSSAVNSNFSERYITLIDVFERLIDDIKKDKTYNNISEKLIKYATYEYFFVLRKAVKSRVPHLVKMIKNKDKIIKEKVYYKLDKISIIIFLLKTLYKVNSKVLIKFFKFI